MKKRTYFMSLCQGSHKNPYAIDGSIFPNEVDPIDFDNLNTIASNNVPSQLECDFLVLYATEPTSALLAVVNICIMRDINLMVMHCDKNTGNYCAQVVFTTI